LKLT